MVLFVEFRWVNMVLYFMPSMMNAVAWITFSSISTQIEKVKIYIYFNNYFLFSIPIFNQYGDTIFDTSQLFFSFLFMQAYD